MKKRQFATETDLLKGLRNRDQRAFSQLYDHYSSALFGIILRLVKDQETAQDLLQDVLVKVYTKVKNFDANKGRLFTWLFRIAQNTAIDYLRSQKGQSLSAMAVQLHNADAIRYIDFYHWVPAQAGSSIGIREQVDLLDDKYRVLIELVYFKGYTHQQAAYRLAIPIGTVKTRIRTGLRLLRKPFAELAN